MSTKIPEHMAISMINNYRVDLPSGELKSAWFDNNLTDAIIRLSQTHQLNGLRVYLAKYTEDDSENGITAGTVTIILVPTQSGIVDGGNDIPTEYYDYSRLCPPYCDGDEGDDDE